MANTRFDYQYRDSGGSKNCDFVVFANPNNLSIREIRVRLERAIWGSEFFIAHQIRIPEVFVYLDGSVDSELDHCFHHFDSVEATDHPPTDKHVRSISDFLHEVELQSHVGWQLFDPEQRFSAA